MLEKNRIRVLSVGISDYSRTELQSLPSSIKDARGVYETFANVLGKDLDTFHSVLAVDITADIFSKLLTFVLDQDFETEKLLVIYFSGHATIQEQELALHFIDSRSNKYGFITTREIDELMRRFGRPDTLIILDCCYSGMAGGLSKSQSPFFPSRTTVITSSKPIEISLTSDDQSNFTKFLIKSLLFLDQSGERISVNSLFQKISDSMETVPIQKPSAFLSEGNADVVIKPSEFDLNDEKERFNPSFASAITTANAGDREALWYSLDDYFRESSITGVLEEIRKKNYHEPLWFIRRAIGSTLSSIVQLRQQKKKICFDLMDSTQWMDVCCGVIGSRFDVSDDDLARALLKVLFSDNPMDAKWLAFLYLSDRYKDALLSDYDLGRTGLLDTEWGVCEVYERCIRSYVDTKKTTSLVENLAERCQNENVLGGLLTHIALLDRNIFDVLPQGLKSKAKGELINDKNIQRFSKFQVRGILTTTGVSKWLYSKLFGIWRGQVQDSLGYLLQDLPPKTVSTFLARCQSLPSVSSRMSIFQSLSQVPVRLDIEDLNWGFFDEHPWVRRTAVEWLLSLDSYEKVKNELTDPLKETIKPPEPEFLPGNIDLLYSVIKTSKYLGLDDNRIQGMIRPIILTLSATEIDSVEWSLRNDLLPISLRGN